MVKILFKSKSWHQKETTLHHVTITLILPFCFDSSSSGLSPAPQLARSGPVPPSFHHAALPGASSPASGTGPSLTHHHRRCHSHRGACRRPRRRLHGAHGSPPNERHGIPSPHGNNPNVVITWERRSHLPLKPKHTPGFSFSPPPPPRLSFSVFFLFIWPRGTGRTAALDQTQRPACSSCGWGSLCGVRKDEWIWRMADRSRLLQTFHYYLIVTELS